jgi:uncharacterized tellurite resistance protein B-like protein
MIDAIKRFFSDSLDSQQQPHSDQQKHLAAAALMIEIATIDEHFSDTERETLRHELQSQYQIDDKTIHTLMELAEQEHHQATSHYQFTQLINDSFSNHEKFDLLVSMWRIAYADNQLDKYEEYMVRKLSELLHLPHSSFIKAKQKAREKQVN